MSELEQSKDNGRVNYDVTQEQVVEAWQTSENAQEAADKLNMPKAILLARISKYRTLGIPLKAMPRGRPRGRGKTDVARLTKLAESLGRTDPPSPRVKPQNTPEEVSAIMKDIIAGIHAASDRKAGPRG